MPCDTRTGRVFEQIIVPALEAANYAWKSQVDVGTRLGGGRHVVDFVVEVRNEKACLVSVEVATDIRHCRAESSFRSNLSIGDDYLTSR